MFLFTCSDTFMFFVVEKFGFEGFDDIIKLSVTRSPPSSVTRRRSCSASAAAPSCASPREGGPGSQKAAPSGKSSTEKTTFPPCVLHYIQDVLRYNKLTQPSALERK